MAAPRDLATPLAYALAYAALGWHVFPLEPRTKIPLGRLVPRGHLDATTDQDTISKWWKMAPTAGIGISLAASGLVAIDIDPRNGGTETFEALEADHGPLRSDVMAFTGGGGEHHVFVLPAGMHPTLPGTLGRGVDVKCNGYIVVEPSIHPSGKEYGWEASSSPLDGVAPSPLPDWLRGHIRQPQAAETPRTAEGKVGQGGRNAYLSRKAYAMRRAGFSLQLIESAIAAVNADECDPPIADDEVRRIAAGKARVEAEPVPYIGAGPTAGPGVVNPLVMTVEQLHAVAGSVQWAVKGIIPSQGLGFIFGASGTFKSFLALDYALHRCYGMKWLGRRTRQADVVYMAAEGGAGLMRRIQAWHKDRGMLWQDCPLRVVIVPLMLRSESSTLREAIIETGLKPGDVVIDTLAQTYTGNENSNDEMSEWLRTIGVELRDALACCVTIVHHSGHSATERPRGASAIIANADFCLGVFRDEKEMLATVEFVKIKDGDRPAEQQFELARVELGFDEDGDTITSLSARHLADPAEVEQAMQREAQAGRGGRHHLLLNLARTCLTEKELRKAFYEDVNLVDSDAKKHAFYRSRDWAVKNQHFEIVEGVIVWPSKG